MGLPPYSLEFFDQKFRKLLFFPIVNAIQPKFKFSMNSNDKNSFVTK